MKYMNIMNVWWLLFLLTACQNKPISSDTAGQPVSFSNPDIGQYGQWVTPSQATANEAGAVAPTTDSNDSNDSNAELWIITPCLNTQPDCIRAALPINSTRAPRNLQR